MPEPKRVALIIESSRAYGRGCLLGISTYALTHGPWRILHLERSLEQSIPSVVGQWNSDGLITRIENSTIAQKVEALQLPTVDLRGRHCPSGGVMFDTDPAECARLAADHFLERGFWQFAFCGFPGIDFSDRRCAEFIALIAELGHEVAVYERPQRKKRTPHTLVMEARGELEPSTIQIQKWLRSLPHPTAVFTCNDIRGRQVLASCAAAGLAVPDEVAVLGVDDDAVICELSFPPLSSIRPDTNRIGFRGAQQLDVMMSGGETEARLILVTPKGLSTRQSTDVLAHADRELAAAIRFIRDHAFENISVAEVVRSSLSSRATLERRFLRLLDRSPAAEITRVRMERAKMLLVETDYKLTKIASMTGYHTASHFSTVFKRSVGIAPGEFRNVQGNIGEGE